MVVNSPSYYNFSNCYNPLKKDSNGNYYNNSFISDASLIINNFEIYSVRTMKECSDIARRYESPFFLASNYEVSNNNINLNCYIPVPKENNNSQFNSVFTPFTDLLEKLFLTGNARDNLKLVLEESSGNITSIGRNVCIRNTQDNYVYSASGNYALYENKILRDSVLTELSTIRSYDYHLAGKRRIDGTLNYTSFLAKPGIGQDTGGSLYNSFKILLCNNNSTKELVESNKANFIRDIDKIMTYRSELQTGLNELTEDLSKINLITSYSNEILDGLDNYIGDIKLTLKNLFASGGANNGRLGDISYLNNILLFENFIIFIILISFVYITIKNNN